MESNKKNMKAKVLSHSVSKFLIFYFYNKKTINFLFIANQLLLKAFGDLFCLVFLTKMHYVHP